MVYALFEINICIINTMKRAWKSKFNLCFIKFQGMICLTNPYMVMQLPYMVDLLPFMGIAYLYIHARIYWFIYQFIYSLDVSEKYFKI